MNPNTKVYMNGQQLNRSKAGRFTSLKAKARKAWFYTKVVTAVLVINVIIVGTAVLSLTTTQVTASTQTIVTQAPSPVLDRIADCESGNGTAGSASHYHNGQVLMKPNTNGTVDVGKYQINSVWFKQATQLGLDITKESDNKAMAEWIYANKGTGDWSASAHCWAK